MLGKRWTNTGTKQLLCKLLRTLTLDWPLVTLVNTLPQAVEVEAVQRFKSKINLIKNEPYGGQQGYTVILKGVRDAGERLVCIFIFLLFFVPLSSRKNEHLQRSVKKV